MVMASMWKNLTSGIGPPLSALENPGRVRALNLEAIVAPDHGLATGDRGRPIVARDLDLPAAGLRVELDPVDGRGPPHQVELVPAW